MSQLFPRAADAWMRLTLGSIVALAVVVVGMLLALMRSPYITGQDSVVQQPVPFSHQHHVSEVGIDCRYCHGSVEDSAVAGIPSTQICLNCHRYLWDDAPMLALVRSSWREQQPLRWNRVHDLPDHVYFNHAIHVHKGIGCYSCHGAVGEMPLMRQVHPLTMQWCLECHRNPVEHVRPRELVFDPRPLSELTELPAFSDAVDEMLGVGEGPSSTPTGSIAEPQTPTVELLPRLREALAERYGLRQRTDCYTCHR